MVHTLSAPPEMIAGWDLTRFGRYPCPEPQEKWYQVEPTPKLLGAQMCSWENSENDEHGFSARDPRPRGSTPQRACRFTPSVSGRRARPTRRTSSSGCSRC